MGFVLLTIGFAGITIWVSEKILGLCSGHCPRVLDFLEHILD